MVSVTWTLGLWLAWLININLRTSSLAKEPKIAGDWEIADEVEGLETELADMVGVKV